MRDGNRKLEEKTVTGIMLTLLFIGMLALEFNIQPVKTETAIVVPDDYPTIQAAINNANEGDTIYVRNGTYYENVVVNKTVSLIGENRSSTVIDGGRIGTVVTITANEVEIVNFTIQNSHEYSTMQDSDGIYLESSGSIVSDNAVLKNGRGIRMYSSRENILDGNLVLNNSVGILVAGYCDSNLLTNNTVSNNDVGIDLYRTHYSNTLKNNILIGNSHNFMVDGNPYWGLSDFIQDVDTSNTVDGKPIYYLINEHNKQIPTDAGYVGVVNSENITVKDLNLTNNGQGVLFVYTTNSVIENVTVSKMGWFGTWLGPRTAGILLQYSSNNSIGNSEILNNEQGIMLENSHNNTIYANNISFSRREMGTKWRGIVSWYSDGNILSHNTITSNGYGIDLEGSKLWKINNNIISNNIAGIHIYSQPSVNSSDNLIVDNLISNNDNGVILSGNNNTFFHNSFVRNSKQVKFWVSNRNIWDNGYPSGGNYWSHYTSIDLYSGPYQNVTGSDGIWDHPCVIDENNIDRYPLVNPWSPQVTITGRIHYSDNENNYQLVDRALVELYDEDWEFDDLLDATYTTSDGYFVLGPVENNDDEPGESGTRDLYIIVKAENWAADVIDNVPPFGKSWEFKTPTVHDVPNGEHDWGNMSIPADRSPPFHILKVATAGYDYFDIFYDSPPSVPMKWRQGDDERSGYNPILDFIVVSGREINPDQWDDGIILHEYGHFVSDKVGFISPSARIGAHIWEDISDPKSAWAEGWAHFFSFAARNAPSYRDTIDTTHWDEYNAENGLHTSSSGYNKSANALGGSCEGSVAGILWDIFDNVDDDQNNDGVGDVLDNKENEIWDVVISYSTGGLLPHKVYTIFDFWEGWFARGHEHHQEMWDIYYEHGETMPSAEYLTFNFSLGEETFSITILSNSRVAGFNFSQTLKQVSFNVTGPTGTTGFSNVTIPDDLLWGEFTVYKDGFPLVRDVDYTQIYNATHYIFYITYIHTTHVIEVRSTEVITPDITLPDISIQSPENKTYPEKDVPLIFTVSESASWIGYSLDGQNNVTIDGDTTLVGLSDGVHTITVYANDTAGNTGYSDTVYFTVDTVSPKIEILSLENKTYTKSSVSLSFTVDEATPWIGYSLDGQANVTITGNTTISELSNGSHSLIVYAKDTAGNIGTSDIIYFSINIQQTEPFPTWIVAAIVIIAALGTAVYLLKTRKKS